MPHRICARSRSTKSVTAYSFTIIGIYYYCQLLLLSSAFAIHSIGAIYNHQAATTGINRVTMNVNSNEAPSFHNENDTPLEDVAIIVDRVASKADEWKTTPLHQKIQILHQIRRNSIEHRDEWVALLQKSRGVDPTDPLQAYARMDTLITGPYTLGNYLDGIIANLEAIEKTSRPLPPVAVRSTANGKRIVTVYPDGIKESMMAVGMTGEIILADGGGTEKNSADGLQHTSLDAVAVGGVAGVLGAGNFDAPVETLCEMFLKSRVCIFKSNPTNALTDSIYDKIFEPLISKGYLAYLSGGGAVGSALATHPCIDEIVLTGSIETLQKVKWGSTASEQTKNKKNNTPLVTKPICAELGAVTPWIIVPGKQWDRRSVDKHARAVAFAKMANNGYACVSPQLLIVAENWKWRQEFMDRVRYWLGQHPGGASFYPSSAESHSFFKSLPNAEVIWQLGEEGGANAALVQQPKRQPPIFIPNISTDDEEQNVLLQREAWCPVLAEVPIPNGHDDKDSMKFLNSAFQFAEKNVNGSLSTCIIIDDRTMKNNSKELDALIASIPYGIVGVNIYPAYAHGMSKLIWGAYPGYTASGQGMMGNSGLFKNPEKMVLRAPFMHLGRKALEVMDPRQHYLLSSRLTTYTFRPGYLNLVKMFAALFLGI